MAFERRVAHRYAKTILEISYEQKNVESVKQDMMLLHETCYRNPDFVTMLKNPTVFNSKKIEIIKNIFQNKMHPLTISLFEIMSKKRRENVIPFMRDAFFKQYYEIENIVRVEITTPVSLSDAIRNALSLRLKNFSYTNKKKIHIVESLDTSLIGGFTLEVDEYFLDESVKNKMHRLRKNLLA
ncbi:MAG: ATP synthase F1 subunit delta [Chitinophagaceae bacterium]|nr:ATP synthase F1 subunit delta [Chitinophagaceae bacterium]